MKMTKMSCAASILMLAALTAPASADPLHFQSYETTLPGYNTPAGRVGLTLRLPFSGGLRHADAPAFATLSLETQVDWGRQYQGRPLPLYRLELSVDQARGFAILPSALPGMSDRLSASGSGDKTTLVLLGVGLAAGVAVLALGGGEEETADACIAIFPKPPGCP